MNSNKIEQLQSLISRLSILTFSSRKTMSEKDFIGIENRLGYSLPKDYKYFCETIGESLLDKFIDLYCLDDGVVEQSNEEIQEMIERINYGVECRRNNHEPDPYPDRNDTEYIELLNSALIFAEFNGDRVIFWDLRTYEFTDDSYDIYWYSFDCPDAETPIKIGRSFTDFICNFCYGQLACELIPDFCGSEGTREVSYTCHC
jgi:hypothetical protein